jgi:hypothetical protein
VAELLVGEALDLGDPVLDLPPADPEALGQLVAEVGLVDEPGRFGVFVDRRVVEAGPAAVRALGRVRDQQVSVDLHVAGAGGAVHVARAEEARALHELPPAFASPRPAGLPLQVADRCLHSGDVGGFDLGGDRMAAERPEDRGRLRC